MSEVERKRGSGRNTLSFDPKTYMVRPDMRVLVGNPDHYDHKLKHDDVVIVPEFGCKEYDNTLFIRLCEELSELQKNGVKGSEYISWHEGSHVISKNPYMSKTFQTLIERMAKYFNINTRTASYRFNLYRDENDFKPAHHDSAAFNRERARVQNITVTLSLGGTRELAFINSRTGTKIYVPQTNGMLCSFGRDVNIKWLHAINAIPKEEQKNVGRISIVLWGWTNTVIDEPNSPEMIAENVPTHGGKNRVQGYHAGNRKDQEKLNELLSSDQPRLRNIDESDNSIKPTTSNKHGFDKGSKYRGDFGSSSRDKTFSRPSMKGPNDHKHRNPKFSKHTSKHENGTKKGKESQPKEDTSNKLPEVQEKESQPKEDTSDKLPEVQEKESQPKEDTSDKLPDNSKPKKRGRPSKTT